MKKARNALGGADGKVVIDRCNIDISQRAVWIQLAMHDLGLTSNQLGCCWLDVPPEECDCRVMGRFDHKTLPPRISSLCVIRGFLESWEPPTISEGFAHLWRLGSTSEFESFWRCLESDTLSEPHLACDIESKEFTGGDSDDAVVDSNITLNPCSNQGDHCQVRVELIPDSTNAGWCKSSASYIEDPVRNFALPKDQHTEGGTGLAESNRVPDLATLDVACCLQELTLPATDVSTHDNTDPHYTSDGDLGSATASPMDFWRLPLEMSLLDDTEDLVSQSDLRCRGCEVTCAEDAQIHTVKPEASEQPNKEDIAAESELPVHSNDLGSKGCVEDTQTPAAQAETTERRNSAPLGVADFWRVPLLELIDDP
jgi:hypothetical protein